MKLLLGCDPELFLWDKTKGSYISAEGIVPGTKEEPRRLKDGAVQRDGTALEFNIEPSASATAFSDCVSNVLNQCQELVGKDIELRAEPAILFDEEYYATLSENSKQLGCDPDYSAYTGTVNPRPSPIHRMHTGAGHLHLGWTNNADSHGHEHMYDCQQMVQRLDAYFDIFKNKWDTDIQRSRLYGARGAYRPKHYGVEYRVPSNAWVKHPKLWPWIFDSCKFVFDHAVEGKTYNWIAATGISPDDMTVKARFGTDKYPAYPL